MNGKMKTDKRLTPARLFGIALGGILATQNQYAVDGLLTEKPTDERIEIDKNTLARDWGIRTSQELNRQLDVLYSNEGHNQTFSYWINVFRTMDHCSRKAYIASQKQDPERYAELTIVERSLYSLGDAGIYAWDCGRYVMLCRWGAMIGLLSHDEAWERVRQIAVKVQPMYPDWYAYGTSYLTGRHFWVSNLSVSHVRTMMQHVKQLCDDKGAWRGGWAVDLSQW